MKKSSIFFIVLVIIIMVIIFIFSNQEGSISYNQSKFFAEIFKRLNLEIPLINNSIGYTVRKYAHIFLYFVLGVFTSLGSISIIKRKNIKRKNLVSVIISFGICFIYACTDEYHQRFIDGRTGQFSDVLYDAYGFVSAIVLVTLLNFFIEILSKKFNKKDI